MKRRLNAFYAVTLLLLTAGVCSAIQDPAPDPQNGSGWKVDPGDVNTIECQNAASAPGNPVGTYYWFAASESDKGSLVTDGNLTQVTPGVVQVSGSPAQSFSGTDTELITAGTVDNLLANQGYYIYAQACPSLVGANSAGCSDWILIGSNVIKTSVLPASVFITPVPADVSQTNVLTVNASVTSPQNVSVYQLSIQNLDAMTSPIAVSPPPTYPQTSPTQSTTIDSTLYPSITFIPNTKYQYIGQVDYPWGQLAPTSAQDEVFYTTPVDPGLGSVVAFTHFTASVTFANAGGSTPNHTGTQYNVNFHLGFNLTGAIAKQKVVNSVTGLAGEMIPAWTNGLLPGTTYTVGVQAINEGNIPTNHNWKNSNEVAIAPFFVTEPFSLSIVILSSDVVTNAGTARLTVNNGTGLDHFDLTAAPHGTYPDATWLGGTAALAAQDYVMTSLLPNTDYSVNTILCETPGSSQCSGSLPASPAVFTTQPATPTSATTPLTVGVCTSTPGNCTLVAAWQDASQNPNGTTHYLVEACPNGLAFGNPGCKTQNFVKVSGTPQGGSITGLTAETPYTLQVKALNQGGSPWPDSSELLLGSITTITAIMTPASMTPSPVTGQTGTLNVTADNNGGAATLSYNWVITDPGGVTTPPTPCANNNSSTGNSCLETFHQIGNGYSATVTVTDSLSRTIASNVVFNVLPTPQNPVVLSPANSSILQNASAVTFAASVNDQFGNPISNPPEVFSIDGNAGGNSISNSGSFTPSGTVGTYVVRSTVTLNGTTIAGTTNITVQAIAGSVTIIGPTSLQQTDAPTYTVQAFDNSGFPVTPTSLVWSVDPGGAGNSIASSGQYTAHTAGFDVIRATVTVNGTIKAATLRVTIAYKPTTVTISPATPQSVVIQNPSNAFNVTVLDPFGGTIPTPVIWSISGGGTLSPANPALSVVFTAGSTPGVFTLTASTGGVTSAPVTINVSAAGPIFDSLLFTMNPTFTGGSITVNAHDNATPQLSNAWSSSDLINAVPSPATGNGVPMTTTYGFHKAGQFTLTDTITDIFNVSGSSSAAVTVPQILSGITVSPNNVTIQSIQNQQFTATPVDQFGNPMTLSNVSWSASAGNVSGSGSAINFNSPSLGTGIRITATAKDPLTGKSISGAATVNVVSYDLSGAYAYPVPFKSTQGSVVTFTGLGSDAKIRIYTASGHLVFNTEVTSGTYPWQVVNNSSQKVASGVYLYVIESPAGKKDGKLIIIQ